MSQEGKKPFLRNLNGLRFLAASYTVGFHYFLFPDFPLLNRFFSRGHISVPFFFLLSGFVLTYSYSEYKFKEKGRKLKYWISRWIRLAPIYYIALFLALPLLYLHLQKIPFSTGEILFNTLNHLTLTQGFFGSKKILSFWNNHSWSLSVEFFLYLVSPFLISLSLKIRPNRLIIISFLIILLNAFLFYFTLPPFLIFKKFSYYFPPLYLGVFFNGVLLSRIYLAYREKIERFSSFFFLGSVIVLFSAFMMDWNKNIYSTFNPLFLGGFSFLILGSCKETKINNFLGGKSLFLLGEASYAMYIFQAPVKLFSQQFLSKVIGYQESTGFMYAIIVFLSITAVSVIVSQKVDPFLRKKLRINLLKS
ncbi:MAG: acyltransferase [Halobacteriovoraceae bacterium]|nr:acyltransferase [Halobacteriovoraceae bacterium]